MKILFTGGGSGGHFMPIIAIIKELRTFEQEKGMGNIKLIYMSNEPFNKELLDKYGVVFKKNIAGKRRLYFSILNIIDIFKMALGIFLAFFRVFFIYPDVIVGKGGYPSFPVLFAGRFFKIPIFIHESDTVPGRVNKWAGKHATRIAVSFDESFQYFPSKNTAVVGTPIIKSDSTKSKKEALLKFNLIEDILTIGIVGGSQGAQFINNKIVDILPSIISKYQVIHVTGPKNFKEIVDRIGISLSDDNNKDRYKVFKFLSVSDMDDLLTASDIIITRAGATMLFEIAYHSTPAIIVPITKSNGDHQRRNAISYTGHGAGVIIEEQNLTKNIILTEIERIVGNPEIYKKMSNAARDFSKPEAAKIIANEILNLAIRHG